MLLYQCSETYLKAKSAVSRLYKKTRNYKFLRICSNVINIVELHNWLSILEESIYLLTLLCKTGKYFSLKQSAYIWRQIQNKVS